LGLPMEKGMPLFESQKYQPKGGNKEPKTAGKNFPGALRLQKPSQESPLRSKEKKAEK